MNLTLRQLKIFEAVARHLSFTKASEELHLTQPAVSMQIKQLEQATGVPLFELVGKRVYLTEAGQELQRYSRSIAMLLTEAEQVFEEMKGLRRGRLTITVASTANYFVPRLWATFRKRHPDVSVSLDVTNREGLIRALAENQADLVIMGLPPEGLDLVAESFMPNPLVVIAPTHHALAGHIDIAVRALEDEEFVLREQGSGTRQAAEHFFAAHDMALRPRLELGSNEAVKQAVAGGLGLSVLSAHALAHAADEGIAVLQVVDTPVMSQWQVVYPAGKRLSPLAAAFLRFLQARAPELNRTAQARLTAARR